MISTQTIEHKASGYNPSADDFAALLDESLSGSAPAEGAVVKGKIVAIEKDLAVIDVGLKSEGRVPLKEFGSSIQAPTIHVGDEVEVYVERIENSAGEAVLSREKARREDSWTKLEQRFNAGEKVEGIIFNRVKGGFLYRRSRRRRGLSSRQPSRHPAHQGCDAFDERDATLPDPENGSQARQYRRFAQIGLGR